MLKAFLNYVLVAAVLSHFLYACAAASSAQTIKQFPHAQKQNSPPPVLFLGTLIYEGNGEYLPRTVGADSKPSKLLIRYSYEVNQGREGDLLPVEQYEARMAAAAIEGMTSKNYQPPPPPPIRGTNWLFATATLELVKDGRLLKTYVGRREIVEDKPTRTTLTELRRRALLDVRDQIEREMIADKDIQP